MDLICLNSCDTSHIITSSNVKKKRLSFKGWERCVEAFSQGKGNLSFQCSRILGNAEEEIITWSSSDGEGDEDAFIFRQRPNRTLNSLINFDDCISTRKDGRRRPKARFTRSIVSSGDEKRRDFSSLTVRKELHGSVAEENHTESAFANGSGDSESFTPSRSTEFSETSHSSEYDSQVDISLLNKAIVVFSGVSPRSPNQESQRLCLNTSLCGKSSNNCLGSESPVIKSKKKFRRKSLRRLPEVQEEEKETEAESVDKIVCQNRNKSASRSEEDSLATVITPSSEDAFHTVKSPIISRSTGFKRKRIRKKFNNLLTSPILGSSKSPSFFKRKNQSRSGKLKEGVKKALEERNPARNLDNSKSTSSPIFHIGQWSLSSIYNKDENLQKSTVTVKRSLDFSKKSIEQENSSSCVDDTINSSESSRSQVPLIELEPASESLLQKDDLISRQKCKSKYNLLEENILNHVVLNEKINSNNNNKLNTCNDSCIIEDINTEALDNFAAPKVSKEKRYIKKKNTNDNYRKKVDETFSIEEENTERSPLNLPKTRKYFEKDRQLEGLDYSNTIEEINTEALDLCSENNFRVGDIFTKKSSEEAERRKQIPPALPEISNKKFCFHSKRHVNVSDAFILDHSQDQTTISVGTSSGVTAMDIESDTSSYSETSYSTAIPLVEIERASSPTVSSSIGISQSSSSPGPDTNKNLLPVFPKQDEFNAPPKRRNRKLKPGGLASRLQRLLNAQKSSTRLWQYKRTKESRQSRNSSGSNSSQDSSVVLFIDRRWTEYCHIVLQCQSDCETVTASGNVLSGRIIIVLDPHVIGKLDQVMSASAIRIFPPWQALKLNGATVILCVTCAEFISSSPAVEPLIPQQQVQSFFCQDCIHNKCSTCSHFPDLVIKISEKNSKKLLDLIFPRESSSSGRLLLGDQDAADSCLAAKKCVATMETVAELVTKHFSGQASSGSLAVSVLRIFKSRQIVQLSENSKDADPVWSVFGCDINDQLCEIVLGPLDSSNHEMLSDLESGDASGRMYYFKGFLPLQRVAPFRMSRLWNIACNITDVYNADQDVFYVLGPASTTWYCKPIESPYPEKRELYRPKFSFLQTILPTINSSEYRRGNLFCRLLHSTGNRIYVTDISMYPEIISIALGPATYISNEAQKVNLVSIEDVEISRDELRTDKYSKIVPRSEEEIPGEFLYNKNRNLCLASLLPSFPPLSASCAIHTLTTVTGSIIGIDEESAFMWPACGSCGNELLCLDAHYVDQYRCEKCSKRCDKIVLRMSLQVIASCPALPSNSVVRIQLLQDTIQKLLPSNPPSGDGYEMDSVLGRKLTALSCEVKASENGNFTLQEFHYNREYS